MVVKTCRRSPRKTVSRKSPSPCRETTTPAMIIQQVTSTTTPEEESAPSFLCFACGLKKGLETREKYIGHIQNDCKPVRTVKYISGWDKPERTFNNINHAEEHLNARPSCIQLEGEEKPTRLHYCDVHIPTAIDAGNVEVTMCGYTGKSSSSVSQHKRRHHKGYWAPQNRGLGARKDDYAEIVTPLPKPRKRPQKRARNGKKASLVEVDTILSGQSVELHPVASTSVIDIEASTSTSHSGSIHLPSTTFPRPLSDGMSVLHHSIAVSNFTFDCQPCSTYNQGSQPGPSTNHYSAFWESQPSALLPEPPFPSSYLEAQAAAALEETLAQSSHSTFNVFPMQSVVTSHDLALMAPHPTYPPTIEPGSWPSTLPDLANLGTGLFTDSCLRQGSPTDSAYSQPVTPTGTAEYDALFSMFSSQVDSATAPPIYYPNLHDFDDVLSPSRPPACSYNLGQAYTNSVF